mgnify:CR=1 FL=1
MSENSRIGARNIALVGPYLSGKTSLLESILFITDAINRKGKVTEGNTVGDSSVEARTRGMGVELNVATANFLGDQLTFLDCPGSIEFMQEANNALVGADAAVLVCEADPSRALTVAPIIKALEDRGLPTVIFINKVDRGEVDVEAMIESLGPYSNRPIVPRQLPIISGEKVSGYLDLATDRAFSYQTGGASETIEMPAELADDRAEARYRSLEKISDFSETLMEKLLEEVDPSDEEVFSELSDCFQSGVIVPVMFGSGELEHGVRRLLKLLRHEAPSSSLASERVGAGGDGEPIAQILKTYVTQHGGKLSVVRVWRGEFADGSAVNGERISGISRLCGLQTEKLDKAQAGDVVAFGRLDVLQTGSTLCSAKDVEELPGAAKLSPVYSLAITAAKREDEVKLSGALAKLSDEDPSVVYEQSSDTGELLLHGQGEIHLRVAGDRLKNKHGIEVETSRPLVPYKEAIKKSVSQHARFKRQSGGHGQFGDVHIDIKPLPRGSGFTFEDRITGGVVPKQYIPAVGAGVQEYLKRGPLGFPVVDVSVTLTDGQYHAVDSSELAFKTAGRIAMTEGMPKCDPVLLEPILAVDLFVPSEYTSKINSLVSSRRGQILGFEPRDGWLGWDVVHAQLPQNEIQDLVVEVRSATTGVGTYTANFDRLQELHGRLADDVVSANASE